MRAWGWGEDPVMLRIRFIVSLALVALALLVAEANAAPVAKLTAVGAPPKSVRPGAAVTVTYAAVGTTRKPARATLSATMQAAGGRPVTVLRKAIIKVRRGTATKGRVTLAIPRGQAAKTYMLKICLRAGRRAAACRVAGSFALGQECSCAPPQPPGPKATTPGPAPAATGPASGSPSAAGTSGPGPDDASHDDAGHADEVFDASARPNPVTVDPTLDTARSVTQVVDTIGGTLEATGADGTHYTLEIPYMSLAARTPITMTPLKSVADLPFSGGLVAGVQLAPDGLRFAKPARLTITNAPHVAADREVPFSYRGDGRDLALAPLVQDPNVQAFDLQHFSAYGIASGTLAERRAQLIRVTDDVESQLQQIVAFEIATDRTNFWLHVGRPMDWETLQDAMGHYHDQVIKPLLEAAMTDVDLAARAMEKYLAWERQMELMFKDDLVAERAARRLDFLKVVDNVAHHYYARCLAGDPGAIPVLLAFSRQIQLMPDSGSLPELQRVFDACAQFEVDVETTVDQAGQGPEDQRFHGHLTLPHVRLTLQGGFQVYGSGTWTQDAFTITPQGAPDVGCWLATSGFKATDSHFVGPLVLGVNWIEDLDGEKYHLQEADIADVGLAFAPLQTYEEWHYGFCGGSTGQGGSQNWLGTTLDALHADERPAGATTWEIENWTRPSNDAFVLTKRYQRTKMVDNAPTTEDTRITLRHTPAPVS